MWSDNKVELPISHWNIKLIKDWKMSSDASRRQCSGSVDVPLSRHKRNVLLERFKLAPFWFRLPLDTVV